MTDLTTPDDADLASSDGADLEAVQPPVPQHYEAPVAVALEPVEVGATFAPKTLRVRADGQDVRADPQNGYVYDELTHSIRFQGAAKKQAFLAKIDITYEEHR